MLETHIFIYLNDFYLSEWFSVAKGSSLERVKRYFTIRNKLEGVNEKLKELGVQSIDFDYEKERVGFKFDRMWLQYDYTQIK